MDWGNHPLFRTFQMGELSRFLRFGMLFPTSLRGVLVFDSVSRRRLPPPPPPPPVFSLTKNFVTHHLSHTTLSTTTLSHTIFHRQLCHTPSFTHNFFFCHTPSFTDNFATHHLSHTTFFVTHHLSQTTLPHTIFQAQLCHTPSFTQKSHTTLSTTTFSHTIFHTQLCHPQLCHTPSFTHNFVTQNFVNHNFFPTSLYLATSTFTLRGRRGTYGTGLALVARLGAVSRPGRRATLCGRRGTW